MDKRKHSQQDLLVQANEKIKQNTLPLEKVDPDNLKSIEWCMGFGDFSSTKVNNQTILKQNLIGLFYVSFIG